MATRQNSTNGKPKSPRIQVVLPELICEQLTILADNESRTVSNMAKVLIQEGIKKYFEKENINHTFVGHPLLEDNEKNKIDIKNVIDEDKKIISIFSGSRYSEINVLMPILLKFIKMIKELGGKIN